MKKKSFFLGVLTGAVLTFVILFFIGLANQKSADNEQVDPVQYLEKPMSYENKEETSFKVLQVFENAALAHEASDEIGGEVMYFGNTVVILGKNYYSDQIVKVKNPQRVGTYSYTSQGGMPMTVPVIDGDME